ncbi:hypothetical protein CN210_26640 [Sinorhizobium meliloti]|nr:hypothetical protein CN210_26640 [Sinorhizobium meliloti]
MPLLLNGLWLTIAITLASLALATVLGLTWALLRTSGIKALALPTRIFVECVRGIPILVVLFYIYFVMPDIGIDLTAFQAGVAGLALTYSCYIGETLSKTSWRVRSMCCARTGTRCATGRANF